MAALIATAASSSLHPSAARGDADPASDVLLESPAFYPYQPPPSMALQDQLNGILNRLHKEGLNLKVAIIGSPIDLGAIPNMFGKPQTYAEFLEREIAFSEPVSLLVVMPAGFGLVHAGSPSILAGLKPDATGRSDGLTRSGLTAVKLIARAAGKPVPSVADVTPSGSSGSGTSPLVKFGLPVVLVLLAAYLAFRLQRRRIG